MKQSQNTRGGSCLVENSEHVSWQEQEQKFESSWENMKRHEKTRVKLKT
jgi:hypothetical protein